MNRNQLLAAICPSSRMHNCEKYYCFDCNRELIKCLDEYDKHVIEQYKADTNLKDTIREIHDNVAQEMYCKGIDDFMKAIICELKNKHTDMQIVDIFGNREKLKEKNSQYLECENLVYKIAEELRSRINE